MNRYGVIAQRHWARWLPRQYAAISDPESFFTTLGEGVARQIDDLTDELVGEIRQNVSASSRGRAAPSMLQTSRSAIRRRRTSRARRHPCLGSAYRLARRNVPGDMLGVPSDSPDQH